MPPCCIVWSTYEATHTSSFNVPLDKLLGMFLIITKNDVLHCLCLFMQREIAKTTDNKLQYVTQFSKSAGRYLVRKVKVPKDYSFRHEILQGIVTRCTNAQGLKHTLQSMPSVKETLLSERTGVIKPDKETAVAQQRTRFM